MASELTGGDASIGADVVDPFQRLLRQLASEVADLDESVLGWTPAPDTTPISNLVLHTLGAARRHLGNLTGSRPNVDRAAEFAAATLPAGELVQRIEAAVHDLERLRGRLTTADLLATREQPARDLSGHGLVVLQYAYGHVAEHLAQVRLTKQLHATLAGG